MMCFLRSISMVAQAASELDELELTAGVVLSGCLVLCAFAGSILTIAVWGGRLAAGQSPIPPASRRTLPIPLQLIFIGLLVALFMVLSAVLMAVGTLESGLPQQPAADDAPLSPEVLVHALVQTVYFDLGLLAAFGIPFVLLRRGEWTMRRHAGAVPSGNASGEPGATVESSISSSILTNPHAVRSVWQGPGGHPVNSLAVPDYREPWKFGPEFRYAAEACLVAWLPTAALRLIMVFVIQDEAQHPFLEMIMNGVPVSALMLIILTAVVLAPLVEELLYRVVILGGLLGHTSGLVALCVSSVLFSFAHGFPDSLALLPLAFVIGWTYQQRRSYRTVVLVHFLFNGFNILLAGAGLM